MKNNNQMWTTIVVALVIAVISSVVTFAIMNANEPQTSPPGAAASCDRDSTCETKSIVSEGSIEINNGQALYTNVIKGEPVETGLQIGSDSQGHSLTLYGPVTTNNDLTVGKAGEDTTATVYSDLVVLSSDPTFKALTGGGAGNGYVCATDAGELYRSQTPCV